MQSLERGLLHLSAEAPSLCQGDLLNRPLPLSPVCSQPGAPGETTRLPM